MIRVSLFNNQAYGFDISDWENQPSYDYNNLLTEDLIERVKDGDIIMYFDCNESAEDWCNENNYKYELVELDDDN